MSEEKNKLISVKLYTEYYKNNIKDRYIRNYSDNAVIDNDVLKADYGEYVYITTLDKHNKLQKENQELKKQLDTSNELVAQSVQTEMKLRDENNRLRKEYQETYKDVRIEIKEYKSQQKEFIEYMNKTIEELECDDVDDEELKGYLIQRIYTFKEILSTYEDIIGENK